MYYNIWVQVFETHIGVSYLWTSAYTSYACIIYVYNICDEHDCIICVCHIHANDHICESYMWQSCVSREVYIICVSHIWTNKGCRQYTYMILIYVYLWYTYMMCTFIIYLPCIWSSYTLQLIHKNPHMCVSYTGLICVYHIWVSYVCIIYEYHICVSEIHIYDVDIHHIPAMYMIVIYGLSSEIRDMSNMWVYWHVYEDHVYDDLLVYDDHIWVYTYMILIYVYTFPWDGVWMGTVGCGDTEGQENKGERDRRGAFRACFAMYDRGKTRLISRSSYHM